MQYKNKESGSTVEALPFHDNAEALSALSTLLNRTISVSYAAPNSRYLTVRGMRVNLGDFIIKSSNGHVTILNETEFNKAYEPVESTTSNG